VELVGQSGDQNGFISHLCPPAVKDGLAGLDEYRLDGVKDGARLGSRQVDGAVRELMLENLIK